MKRAAQKRDRRRFVQGDVLEVSAHVGGDLDGGESFDLKGQLGEVVGCNPTYRHHETGERMVSVVLDEGGAVVAVPTRAVTRPRRVFVGIGGSKYEAIFGRATTRKRP